jgi:hypothetical protein
MEEIATGLPTAHARVKPGIGSIPFSKFALIQERVETASIYAWPTGCFVLTSIPAIYGRTASSFPICPLFAFDQLYPGRLACAPLFKI